MRIFAAILIILALGVYGYRYFYGKPSPEKAFTISPPKTMTPMKVQRWEVAPDLSITVYLEPTGPRAPEGERDDLKALADWARNRVNKRVTVTFKRTGRTLYIDAAQ